MHIIIGTCSLCQGAVIDGGVKPSPRCWDCNASPSEMKLYGPVIEMMARPPKRKAEAMPKKNNKRRRRHAADDSSYGVLGPPPAMPW